MSTVELDPKTTAVVVIDLQNGIVSMKTAPYPPELVIENSKKLVSQFRKHNAMIVYVRVDMGNLIKVNADSMRDPKAALPPKEASELILDSGFMETDTLITKRSWGAFEHTDLEKKLHEHGIKTIVLCGIATNFGVESTARTAYGLGFDVVFAEDAMSSASEESHKFATQIIFPRIGKVRKIENIHTS